MAAVLVIIFPQMQVSVKRLREILDAKILIKDGDEKNVNFTGKGTLEFKNVNYKFSGAKENILSDISFKAESGDFIGIIGATGSGKTTLMNLIPRFSDPSEGQILVDGVDTKRMKLSTLRNKVGYSQQKANLLNRSISDNIGLQYAEPTSSTSTKKIELASEVSQARVFIDNLENKYATIIAQNATNVSGGQKQRISIARTIVDHPEIMLFDDSFSALDYATDLKLRKELFEIYKDSTKIVVASRIATIIKANKIIVLDEGKIVETGTHKELFKNSLFYRNIVLSQMTKKEATNG
jgi:ATP-binding cassette subfamily B protein